MGTLRLVVEIDTLDGSEDEMARLFEQYLTLPEHPFQADYGPEAWGGYDGPIATGVRVVRDAQ